MTKSKGKLAAALLVTVLALAAWLLTRAYDAPELGRRALETARQATGIAFTAESVRFRPLGGLELRGLRASPRAPLGEAELEIRELRLGYRVAALFGGRVEIDRVEIVEPRVVVTLGARSRAVAPPVPPLDPSVSPRRERAESRALPSTMSLLFDVTEFRVEDGGIAVRSLGAPDDRISFEGLSLDLEEVSLDPGALTLVHGLSGSGAVAIGRLGLEGSDAVAVSGAIRGDRGRLELSELELVVDGAPWSGSVDLDFNVLPFRYTLSLKGALAEPEVWIGAARLRLEASGFGTSSRNLSGEGEIEIPPGAFPDAPWTRALGDALGETIAGLVHEGARTRFDVDSGQMTLERFRVEAPPHAVEVEGTIEIDGPLHLRVALASAGGETRRARLYGTVGEPHAEPE